MLPSGHTQPSGSFTSAVVPGVQVLTTEGSSSAFCLGPGSVQLSESCPSVEVSTDEVQKLCCWWSLTLVVLSVQLLRVVSAEVPEDDPADLHALPGVPHPAERGPGSQGRTAGTASLKRPDPEPDSLLCVCELFDMYDFLPPNKREDI